MENIKKHVDGEALRWESNCTAVSVACAIPVAQGRGVMHDRDQISEFCEGHDPAGRGDDQARVRVDQP